MKSTFYHEPETKQSLINFLQNAEILSMNQQCKNFEVGFAQKQGRKYAVMINSGSSANLLLIQALLNLGKLKKGDKIGFSSLTWATNIMPIIQLGLTPIPIDCEITTLNVSTKSLEQKISSLKALFLTNVLGFSGNLTEIKTLCDEKNVLLLEDNCESLGSKTNGRLLGNFGLASTFSFFVGHHLSTIEGGMVCTDDKELADMVTITRAHGWDRNLDSETQKKLRTEAGVDDFYAKYTFYDLAYGVRPTEISGLLGNSQLPYWDEIVNKRQDNFNKFHDIIKQNNDFYAFELGHMEIISNFSMPVICKSPEIAKKYKDKFNQVAEIRPVIAGDMTKQPFYKKYISEPANCPNSELVHNNGFYFPNNPELTDSEVTQLCEALKA